MSQASEASCTTQYTLTPAAMHAPTTAKISNAVPIVATPSRIAPPEMNIVLRYIGERKCWRRHPSRTDDAKTEHPVDIARLLEVAQPGGEQHRQAHETDDAGRVAAVDHRHAVDPVCGHGRGDRAQGVVGMGDDRRGDAEL